MRAYEIAVIVCLVLILLQLTVISINTSPKSDALTSYPPDFKYDPLNYNLFKKYNKTYEEIYDEFERKYCEYGTHIHGDGISPKCTEWIVRDVVREEIQPLNEKLDYLIISQTGCAYRDCYGDFEKWRIGNE